MFVFFFFFFLFVPKCFHLFSNCQVFRVGFGFITFMTSELKLSLIINIKQKE